VSWRGLRKFSPPVVGPPVGGRTTDTEAALTQEAEAKKDARGGGPLICHVPDHADFSAQRRGFVVRAGMDAHKAGDLRITDGGRPLEYCSEKIQSDGQFHSLKRSTAGAHSARASSFYAESHPWGCPLAAGRAIRYIPRPGKRP
jgi:hypothetical protein